MGLSPTLKGRLKMHSSPERNRDRNDKIVQKSKKMNFVIWSNHTDNLLQGHKFGNYKPAMLNRSIDQEQSYFCQVWLFLYYVSVKFSKMSPLTQKSRSFHFYPLEHIPNYNFMCRYE